MCLCLISSLYVLSLLSKRELRRKELSGAPTRSTFAAPWLPFGNSPSRAIFLSSPKTPRSPFSYFNSYFRPRFLKNYPRLGYFSLFVATCFADFSLIIFFVCPFFFLLFSLLRRPWFEILEAVMDRIVANFTPHLTSFINVHEILPFLDALMACVPPESGRTILSLPLPGPLVPGECTLPFEVPIERRLFGRPPLALFLKPLSPNKLLNAFAALVMERRVIVHSNHLDRLTHFMFGLTSLLYPLEWPHPFSSILCKRGLGYCAATFPFLFGVHTSLLPQVHEQELESITWINLDAGTVNNPEDDGQYFRTPSIHHKLASAIEAERTKSARKPYRSTGDALWNPFLSFWASLIVPSLKTVVPPDFSFVSASATKLCDATLRSLFTKVTESQSFQQYLDDRMAWLKGEIAPSHEFDVCVSRLTGIRSLTTLDAYYESISLHGVDVIIDSLFQPSTSQPIVRISSPPVAIFSNALSGSPSSSSSDSAFSNLNSNDTERRALPRKPTLKSRPISVGPFSQSSLQASMSSSPSESNVSARSTLPTNSQSYNSSSCAPSSTSSLTDVESSGPPSYGSDMGPGPHVVGPHNLLTVTPPTSSSMRTTEPFNRNIRMSTPPSTSHSDFNASSPSGSPHVPRHTYSLSSSTSNNNGGIPATGIWERTSATERLRESPQKPWEKHGRQTISPESSSPTLTHSMSSTSNSLSESPRVTIFSATNPFAAAAASSSPHTTRIDDSFESITL